MPNSINPAKVARVSLEPLRLDFGQPNLFGESEIKTIGMLMTMFFLTKIPEPMIDCLSELGDIKFYFLYTITGYPKEIDEKKWRRICCRLSRELKVLKNYPKFAL